MKSLYLCAVLVATTPLLSQQTGVSRPPDTPIEDTATITTADTVQRNVPVVSGPVVVLPDSSPTNSASSTYASPASSSVGTEAYGSPVVTLKHHEVAQFDPDGAIVGDVPEKADELATGTLLRVRLRRSIETASTQEDTPFTAEVAEPIKHMGRVVIPAGSMMEGRITQVRGGRRFHGAALIHLEPQDVVLPDGTRMSIRASVVDTDQYANTRIDAEGNVVRKDHAKETLAAMSLTTGSAAAAGGIIGGVPGALVGAGIGAGVSTVWWLKQDRQTQLPADSLLIMALTSPLTIRPLVQEPEYSQAPRRESNPADIDNGRAPVAGPAAEPQSFVPMN